MNATVPAEVEMRCTIVLLLLVACSDPGQGTPDAGGVDAPPAGWQPLITKSWSLAAGTENTSDIALTTLESDYYIGGIRPIAPPGTHHTVLAQGVPGLGVNIIYASGVGTNELVFPTGVGLRLSAGMLLGLQLHVFNTTDDPMEGTSGIEILHVDPTAITDEADLLLAGPTDLAIDPGPVTITGTCTIAERQTLFALFPHMHQLGTHLKTTLTVGGTDRVIHDASYNFSEQAFLPVEPVVLEPGDRVTTECTWDNTTSQTVTWGESSTTEMCFSILYRYPTLEGDACMQ